MENIVTTDGAMEPERIIDLPGDPLSYEERNPDDRAVDHLALRDPADNDQRGKEDVEEWKGKDNIYKGILWMKDKYEQYRDQSDQRYALLKEELSQLERRYQDLLLSLENKMSLPATAQQETVAGTATMSGTIIIDETVITDDTAALRQQIEARQLIIEELEEQLRVERLKVEELVAKLQHNSQLLMNIYQELDKSFQLPKEAL